MKVTETKAAFDEIARLISEAGAASATVELRPGSPTSDLLAISGQLEYSLIVKGTQGKGFIKEVFLGSVSHNLVRLAHQPVLLVPIVRGSSKATNSSLRLDANG